MSANPCILCYLVPQSCPTLCNPMDCSSPGSSVHGDSPGKNTGVGCHALLQGIFPTQGLNPGLPHYRWILYHLSHQGSPGILEWVVCPFSRGSSWPLNKPGVSYIVRQTLYHWATREAPVLSFVIRVAEIFKLYLMCIILEFIFSKIKENLFVIFHLFLRINHWLENSLAI